MKYYFRDCIPIFLIFYLFTSYLSKYLGYTWEILACVVFFLVFPYTRKMYYPLSFKIFILIFLVIFFGSIYTSVSATIIKTVLASLPVLLMGFYIYMYEDEDIEKYIPLINFFSIFFSFMTILPFLSPHIYTTKVLEYLPLHVRDVALMFYGRGLSSGIVSQTGLNAWFSIIGLASSFSFFISRRKGKYLWYMLFYFMAIVVTGRRGALIFTLLSLAIIYVKISDNKMITLGRIAFVILCIIVGVYILFPDIIGRMLEKTFSGNFDLSSGRFHLWQTAWELFKTNPLFGCGFGYFSVFMNINVHNVYIQFICETGLIGFSLFCLFIIINIMNLRKVLSIKNINHNYEVIFSTFIEIFFVFYCFVESGFNNLYILMLYFTAVCVIEKKLYNNRRKNNVYSRFCKELSF